MEDFLLHAIVWTLALYGLFEIIKTIFYIWNYTNLKADGIYLIIAAKNQENKIEGFLRSFLFKLLYGKEESVKEILVTDLESEDSTKEILDKMAKDYDCIKSIKWRDCKAILDDIDHNKNAERNQ